MPKPVRKLEDVRRVLEAPATRAVAPPPMPPDAFSGVATVAQPTRELTVAELIDKARNGDLESRASLSVNVIQTGRKVTSDIRYTLEERLEAVKALGKFGITSLEIMNTECIIGTPNDIHEIKEAIRNELENYHSEKASVGIPDAITRNDTKYLRDVLGNKYVSHNQKIAALNGLEQLKDFRSILDSKIASERQKLRAVSGLETGLLLAMFYLDLTIKHNTGKNTPPVLDACREAIARLVKKESKEDLFKIVTETLRNEGEFLYSLETRKLAVDQLVSLKDDAINARFTEIIADIGRELGDYVDAALLQSHGYTAGEREADDIPRDVMDAIAERVLGPAPLTDPTARVRTGSARTEPVSDTNRRRFGVDAVDDPQDATAPDESWADFFEGTPASESPAVSAPGTTGTTGKVRLEDILSDVPAKPAGTVDFLALKRTALTSRSETEAREAIDLLAAHEREHDLEVVAGERDTELLGSPSVAKEYAGEKLDAYRAKHVVINLETASTRVDEILESMTISELVLGDDIFAVADRVVGNIQDYLEFGVRSDLTPKDALINARKLNEILGGEPEHVRAIIENAIHANRIVNGTDEQARDSCYYAIDNVRDTENAKRMSTALNARYLAAGHGGAIAEVLHRAHAKMQEIAGSKSETEAGTPVAAPVNTPITFEIYRDGRAIDTKVFTLDEIVVGRSDRAELQILDKKVSRRHALISRDTNGQVTITDLGSSYGTFVNNVKITANCHPLTDGDVIKVGNTMIRISISSALTPVLVPVARTEALTVPDRPAPSIESALARAVARAETGDVELDRIVDETNTYLDTIDLIDDNAEIVSSLRALIRRAEAIGNSEVADHIARRLSETGRADIVTSLGLVVVAATEDSGITVQMPGRGRDKRAIKETQVRPSIRRRAREVISRLEISPEMLAIPSTVAGTTVGVFGALMTPEPATYLFATLAAGSVFTGIFTVAQAASGSRRAKKVARDEATRRTSTTKTNSGGSPE